MNKPLIQVEPSIHNILTILSKLGHQCLIVGGCVRDAVIGIEPKDIDIEVYKINYNDLCGFLLTHGKVDLVGKNFGVIVFTLHNSKLKYDFSVPRKENKIGVGHKDFEVMFDIDMTIKDAAERRDFTFNALAYDPLTDETYDFFGGLDDIKNKIIRHTSDKFKEDYLRIERCKQFQSRLGFTIHPDTISIMKEMLAVPSETNIEANEFTFLPKERLFEEWMKWCEKGTRHDLIFKFMRDTDLIKYYPALELLKNTPQDGLYHPEGDVEIHTELCLTQIDRVIKENNITGTEKVILVMATLLHDIAKPATTEHKLKRGRMTITSEGHEEMGGVIAREFLTSIGFHDDLITPICNLIANHLAGVNISMITALSGRVKAVKKLSRRLHPATIQQLLYIMDADTNGRDADLQDWNMRKIPTGASEIKDIAHTLTLTEKQYEYILMGRHLIEAGLKPSQEFGVILKASYEAQEDGIFNDILGAKIWLNKYLNPDPFDYDLFNSDVKRNNRNHIVALIVLMGLIIGLSFLSNMFCEIQFGKDRFLSYVITFTIVFLISFPSFDYINHKFTLKKTRKDYLKK